MPCTRRYDHRAAIEPLEFRAVPVTGAAAQSPSPPDDPAAFFDLIRLRRSYVPFDEGRSACTLEFSRPGVLLARRAGAKPNKPDPHAQHQHCQPDQKRRSTTTQPCWRRFGHVGMKMPGMKMVDMNPAGDVADEPWLRGRRSIRGVPMR